MGMGLLVSLAALIVAGFFATLAFAPRLPVLSLKDPRNFQALPVEIAHRLRGKPSWTKVPPGRCRSGSTSLGTRAPSTR